MQMPESSLILAVKYSSLVVFSECKKNTKNPLNESKQIL